MKNRMCAPVLLLLTMVMVVCSCSRSSSVAQDPTVAHKLLKQVYAGSLVPVQADLSPVFLKGNPDSMMSKTSATLCQQFGEARELKLKSVNKGNSRSAVAVWAVTAERGTYEMKVAVDSRGKVAGLWFWSSSLQEWIPSHVFGLDKKTIEQYVE